MKIKIEKLDEFIDNALIENHYHGEFYMRHVDIKSKLKKIKSYNKNEALIYNIINQTIARLLSPVRGELRATWDYDD